MPTYRFDARDSSGRSHAGALEAQSLALAANELRGRGWLVLHVAPADPRRNTRESSRWRLPLLPATSLDVETGLRQLAMMTRSGLTLLQGLHSVADYARRARMARVWRRIADHIEVGHGLTEALEHHPRRFPPVVREIVRAGEQSGALDVAFERCAAHLERRRELRATVLQALFYPAIVVALATAVTSYMVLVVIPILEQFLTGMRRQLPALTQSLLSLSHWLQLHLATAMVLGGTTVLAVIALDRWPPARRTFDALLYRVPFVGKIRRLSATAMFTRTLGTLLANGIHVAHALELCEGLLRRPLARARVAATRRAVLDGSSLADGLGRAHPFAPLIVKMVAVGERSGELDTMLVDTAQFHEAELRTWIRRASMLLEPAITIVVGGVVGFVYISFFLAMFAVL